MYDMNELRRLLEEGKVSSRQLSGMGYSVNDLTGEFTEPGPGANELARMIQEAGARDRDVLVAPQAYSSTGRPVPTVNGDFQVYAGEGRPQYRNVEVAPPKRKTPLSSEQLDGIASMMEGNDHYRRRFGAHEAPDPRAEALLQKFLTQMENPKGQKLGAAVEVMGRGKGRYSADGRSVVFADGSTHDLFPKASALAAKAAFERQKAEAEMAKAEAELANKNASTAKTMGEIQDMGTKRAQEAEEQAFIRGAKGDAPMPQAVLEKRYGKTEKGKMWTNDGRLVPVPGGEFEAQAGDALSSGTETVRKIDEMIGQRDASGKLMTGAKPHEGFEDAVGGTWKPFARHIPGTDASDFQARLDEIKGGAFLKAFETLKGGGQITQIEGEKATAAITRMSTAQSEAEFVKAAMEFREVVRKGMERLQSQGGRNNAPQKAGGFRYLGKEG